MSKVAVITLHYIRNYGSVLQTYATQKKLELMGHKVEIIDYVRPNADRERKKDFRKVTEIMKETVTDPLLFFLASILFGVCLQAIYDIIRGIRRVFYR